MNETTVVILTIYLVMFIRNFMYMALCSCGEHIDLKGLLCSFLPVGLSDYAMKKINGAETNERK